MGAINRGQEDQEIVSRFVLHIQQDLSSTHCVLATVTGLGEEGGRVPTLRERIKEPGPEGRGPAKVTHLTRKGRECRAPPYICTHSGRLQDPRLQMWAETSLPY